MAGTVSDDALHYVHASAYPEHARRSVQRSLFHDAAEDQQHSMNPLTVLTHGPSVYESGSGPQSVLRDFAHTNYLYQPSLSLTLQRVLVVGVRSFFLLLSDACSSVWALAVDDQQMMDMVYQSRTALRGSQVLVVLHKCMMRRNAAFFLATNIRIEGMTENEHANYVTQEGEVLPGSGFGMPPVQYSEPLAALQQASGSSSKAPAPPKDSKWRMLVCNGPRVDHYFAGGAAEEGPEQLVSFVNECIPTMVHKEKFDARVSVVRVDDTQVLVTDGSHQMMARFADALGFGNGMFRVKGVNSPPLAVGDVLDLHALGYAHARHKKIQSLLQFYPTCLVTAYVQHGGRDVPGQRVRAMIDEAGRVKQEATAALPEVHVLPAHAVTRQQRLTRRVSLAAHISFCSDAAQAAREEHAADLALAMKTKLTVLLTNEDVLLHTTSMLIPRTIALLMRVSKVMLARVLKIYSPEKVHHEGLTPEILARSSESLPFGSLRFRRCRLYLEVYRRFVQVQLQVSLRAATGGLALYYARSIGRRFSIERVYGSVVADNFVQCMCLTTAQPVPVRRLNWRSAEGKMEVRCALCSVRRERERFLWGLEEDGIDVGSAADGVDMCTSQRVLLGLRHRFMFREDKSRWARVDNMREMLNLFAPYGLVGSEDFPSYSVDIGPSASKKGAHSVPALRHLTRANGSQIELDLLGCRLTLKKLNAVFPLTPGVLLLLHGQRLNECAVIWDAWLQTTMCEQGAPETVHVRCFMPELEPEHKRVRVVLQICGTLIHGARVLYVNRDNGHTGCCLHPDDDFVSFRAHDGRNEMMFSTDCLSFMRLLEQALASQELDADYQLATGLPSASDDLRIWHGGGDANVLADYVVACSFYEVQEVAHMSMQDVLMLDEAYSSVLHEFRVFDFELLDTKMPYTSLDQQPDEALRANRLTCQHLVVGMLREHEGMLEDVFRLSRQALRRAGGMESDTEEDDTPQTPMAHNAQVQGVGSDDDESHTPQYTPYSP